jgi:hypothetical protein
MASVDPLKNLVNTVAVTDREVRTALRAAAKEAERMILAEPSPTRRLQLELAQQQVRMWLTMKDVISDGVGNAFRTSTEWEALADNALFRAAGVDVAKWYSSYAATAEQGLANYLARRHNGFSLSQRVYRQSALARGQVSRIIDNALLLGKSQRELARDVFKFINPATPGGASYAAMRLGRTEVVNAYHANAVARYQQTPWVERVRWVLSETHPRPDECNEFAESGDFTNEPGLYRPGNVPDKPHPQCLCYVTPEMVSKDQFVKDFHSGAYDSYIDGVLGTASVA